VLENLFCDHERDMLAPLTTFGPLLRSASWSLLLHSIRWRMDGQCHDTEKRLNYREFNLWNESFWTKSRI